MNNSQTASFGDNPLVEKLHPIKRKILHLKEKTKSLYFKVLLSQYSCPKCAGELFMTHQSKCTCTCGFEVDPTVAFQKSRCCAATLIRKTHHYACSKCKKNTPSRFLFDERLFNTEYFKVMMKAHRNRAKKKREQIIRQLAQNRSDHLLLLETPCLEAIPDLADDLNAFIGESQNMLDYDEIDLSPRYAMEHYRRHILGALEYGSRMFSGIGHLNSDNRKDRAFRFVTAVFMQHDQEVVLIQRDNDLLIERT